MDRRLYLPEHTWCQDAERRRIAAVPDDVEFATKPRLALLVELAQKPSGIGTTLPLPTTTLHTRSGVDRKVALEY